MNSAKVRSLRASSAACRDCCAGGCVVDEDAAAWEVDWEASALAVGYADDMGYAKAAGVGCVFDMAALYKNFLNLAELSGCESKMYVSSVAFDLEPEYFFPLHKGERLF